MKSLNKFFALLSLITILGINNIEAQCNYSITGVNYNGGFSQFQVVGLPFGTQTIWDFGDGISDTTLNGWISHTYLSSGTYTYCVTIDTCSQICDSIVVDVCNYNINYNNDTINGVIETDFYTNASGTNYLWDFGDGNTSVQQQPHHVYATPGTYIYCLTIDSCPPVCDSIVIPDLCAYSIGYFPIGYPTDPITFYTTSWGSNYLWDFGDGNSSTQQYAQHTYATSGIYYYCLTLDSCPPVCDSIVVDLCNFPMNNTPINGTTFNFSTSIDTSTCSVLWEFGDGNSSTQQYPQHIYTNSSTYYYCLTVDNCPPICDSLVVTNPCDGTTAGFTYTTNGNSALYFNNTSTSNNGFTNFWNFGDGTNSWVTNPTHLFSTPGWNFISLTITDSAGCIDTYNDSVYIDLCTFTMYDTTYSWTPWNNIEFFAIANGTYFAWDFGDGSTYNGSNGNAFHTYAAPGTYYYCLTVDSCPTVCDSIEVTYQCLPYYVYTSPDSLTTATDFWTYGNNGSSYFWDFGDGNTSTLQYPEHTYANSGTYYYCLTIDSCPAVCDTVIIDYCNHSTFANGTFDNGFNFWTSSNSTNLSWDFGDGNTSTQHYPLHYYTNPGTYYYCLTVDSCPPICDSITVIQFNNINGILYLDNNFNCNLDNAADVPQPYAAIELWKNGNVYQYTTTDINGFYSFNVPTNQSYTIKVGNYINGQAWSPNVGCPIFGEYNIFLTPAGSNNNHFGITPTNNFDLTGEIWTWGAFPGAQSWLDFEIYNLGTNSTNALVKLVLDPRCTYDSTATWFWWDIVPDAVIPAVTGDTIVWNSINPNSYYYNWNGVDFVYDTTLTIGDTVCFTLMEFPLNGDIDQTNNVQNLCIPVGNSYDPNIKEVSPVGNGPLGLIQANQKMEYTVHFQNTGTAPADNIYILDVIDSDLDLNSLTILSASHNYSLQLLAGNQIQIRFDNINLPDSFSNEPHSHGYIKYSIEQIPNLLPGTQIENTASIYFDFNAPIITNTTLNTIDNPLSIENIDKSLSDIVIYPNPFKTNVTIEFNLIEQEQTEIFITDVLGNSIVTINNSILNAGDNKFTWKATNTANGVYLLNIKTNNSLQVKKLILNR